MFCTRKETINKIQLWHLITRCCQHLAGGRLGVWIECYSVILSFLKCKLMPVGDIKLMYLMRAWNMNYYKTANRNLRNAAGKENSLILYPRPSSHPSCLMPRAWLGWQVSAHPQVSSAYSDCCCPHCGCCQGRRSAHLSRGAALGLHGLALKSQFGGNTRCQGKTGLSYEKQPAETWWLETPSK